MEGERKDEKGKPQSKKSSGPWDHHEITHFPNPINEKKKNIYNKRCSKFYDSILYTNIELHVFLEKSTCFGSHKQIRY